LAKAKTSAHDVAAEVAPGNTELGVMLPYTPLHHLLFAAGSPPVLVMTSANRSSEPIAYEDDEALQRLSGIADAFLIGERPIARRVDDSVARAGAFGPVILRRSRGYAPGAVAGIPSDRPILALGADLKNTITLVVDGQAFVSQHIGDLSDYQSLRAFHQTIQDFLSMYEVRSEELLVVHDAHPQYLSTAHALEMSAASAVAVQHHRAHIASVLAEPVTATMAASGAARFLWAASARAFAALLTCARPPCPAETLPRFSRSTPQPDFWRASMILNRARCQT
jgi:hydrogenase maturation protein HypF